MGTGFLAGFNDPKIFEFVGPTDSLNGRWRLLKIISQIYPYTLAIMHHRATQDFENICRGKGLNRQHQKIYIISLSLTRGTDLSGFGLCFGWRNSVGVWNFGAFRALPLCLNKIARLPLTVLFVCQAIKWKRTRPAGARSVAPANSNETTRKGKMGN